MKGGSRAVQIHEVPAMKENNSMKNVHICFKYVPRKTKPRPRRATTNHRYLCLSQRDYENYVDHAASGDAIEAFVHFD